MQNLRIAILLLTCALLGWIMSEWLIVSL